MSLLTQCGCSAHTYYDFLWISNSGFSSYFSFIEIKTINLEKYNVIFDIILH